MQDGMMANDRSHGTRDDVRAAVEGSLWTALLLRAQHGDEGALVRLFEVAEDEIWKRAYVLLGDGHEADEVVNETFAQVWKNLKDYDPARSAGRTWLYTIAERRALDHRRKIRRRRRHEVTSLDRPESGGDGAGRPEPLDTTELSPPVAADLPLRQEVVRRALAQLRDDDRLILQLFHLEGMNYEAIAQEMGITVKAVGPRLTRARERLHELLPAGQL
jgi:RNA polymerase sigma-70 factor (ECF subfamily)